MAFLDTIWCKLGKHPIIGEVLAEDSEPLVEFLGRHWIHIAGDDRDANRFKGLRSH